MVFSQAGQITFTASIPEGNDSVNLFFSLQNEAKPYPEFFIPTESVAVSGSTANYSIDIPQQTTNEDFSVVLMHMEKRDISVIVENIALTCGTETEEITIVGGAGSAIKNQNTYTVPSSAEKWAYFHNIG